MSQIFELKVFSVDDDNEPAHKNILTAADSAYDGGMYRASHVKGSESDSFVAEKIIVLKYSRGKKWREKPKTVCINASAITNVGCTSLAPSTLLLASKGSLPNEFLQFISILLLFETTQQGVSQRVFWANYQPYIF